MDTKVVSAALAQYIDTHRTELARVPVIQSQLLELGALVLTAEHYRLNGYLINVSNLVGSKFRVKRTSGGKPWRFSWFTATRGKHCVEIHANLPVAGAYGKDGARYVVDVAVCKPDFLPRELEDQRAWNSADNDSLITFVEAKKLTIYPMLLAQFIGIVHEFNRGFLVAEMRPCLQRRNTSARHWLLLAHGQNRAHRYTLSLMLEDSEFSSFQIWT